MKIFKNYFILTILFLLGCAPAAPEDTASTTTDSNNAFSGSGLYVATGACYSGNGITTFTNASSTNKVTRYSVSGSATSAVVADYFRAPSNAGDSPVGLVNNGTDLLVLVENTTTASLRRIEKISKVTNGTRSTYSNNTTALSAQLRRMVKLKDGYLLVSKSTAAEKMADGTNRLLVGANPWLSLATPASSCVASSTLITDIAQVPSSGLLFFAHAATGLARIGVVSASGYSVAGDCKAGQSAPVATAFPTAMVYDSANQKLIVAYAGNTTATDINSIYAYSVNETSGALSSPQKIYDANLFGSTYNYLLFGISAMAYDSTNKKLYISTAISTATTVVNYRIDKFSYDATKIGSANDSVLTRDETFLDYSADTKCISSMIIAD